MIKNTPQKIDASYKFLRGNQHLELELTGISTIDAMKSHELLFIKNARYWKQLEKKLNKSVEGIESILLVLQEDLVPALQDSEYLERFGAVATVKNVDRALCFFSKPFYDEKFGSLDNFTDARESKKCEIHPESRIGQNVFIGEGVKVSANVTIMPGCVVMAKCEIGEGTTLYPNVTLYPYTKVGQNCRIHSQSTLGQDGYGYNFVDGKHEKIWHFGGVIIGDDVEIGSCSCVDAGGFKPTFVGDGTKIDNHVQVAHNVKVGKHCLLCGHSGLSGSAQLEDYVIIAGGAGTMPGAKLGQGTQVAARSVVTENAVWPENSVIAGHPARPLKEWLKTEAGIRRLVKKKKE